MISIGALKEVVEGKQAEATIVQVIGIRQLPGEEKKWRLNISDGRNSTSLTILDTTLNNLELSRNQLKEGKEAQEGKEGKEGKEARCQEG